MSYSRKLYIIGFDGRDPQVINDTVDTRGRSDWSLQNLIAFDMGGPFQHDVYTMNVDGSHLDRFTDGSNSQGPASRRMVSGLRATDEFTLLQIVGEK